MTDGGMRERARIRRPLTHRRVKLDLVGTVPTSQEVGQFLADSDPQTGNRASVAAVLEALGIPGRRMALAVLAQSFWVGLLGMAVAAPAIAGLVPLLGLLQAKIVLPGWLLVFAAADLRTRWAGNYPSSSYR